MKRSRSPMSLKDYQIIFNFFSQIEGKETSALWPKNWKKSFDSGIFVPTKMRFCDECNNKKMCNDCNNQVSENEKFEANSKLLKRQAPNECGFLFPYFKQ